MGFTVEAIDVAPQSVPNNQPNQFDLPSKEFVGYDPKGVTDITGQPIKRPAPENVQQETTTEVSRPEEPVATDENSVTLPRQISALARKEQAVRQRERVLAQREREVAAKLADAEKYSQLREKVAKNDYSDVEELGVSYDGHTKYQLDKQASEDPVESKYREVKSELEQMKKSQEEQAVRDFEHNQSLWKKEISRVVSDNPEFAAIKKLGLESLVLRHINDSFDEDNVELTAEDAARAIKDELAERKRRIVSAFDDENKPETAPKVLGAPKTSPKTITQNMTVTSEQKKPKPFHLMSESEQIAEAIRRVQAERQGQR